MQSIEAGLCGPKLQSAPEVATGDDFEHILYCPECAARLRLVGVKPVEAEHVVPQSNNARTTLPDWLPEPQQAAETSTEETANALVIAAEPDNQQAASALAEPPVDDAIDVSVSFDDDEPTRVLNSSDLLTEALPDHVEGTGQGTVAVLTNPDPIASELMPSDVNAPEKPPASVERVRIAAEPSSRPILSDAPITRELAVEPSRSNPSNYRRASVGVGATLLVILGVWLYRGQTQPTPSEHVSLAAAAPERLAPSVPVEVTTKPDSPLTTTTTSSRAPVEVARANTQARTGRGADRSTETRPLQATTQDTAATPNTEAVLGDGVDATPREPQEAVFDAEAAVSALDDAAKRASSCRQASDPSGVAVVTITFAPSGRVTTATISGPPFVGTATGSCIAATLRSATVPSFSGQHKTVKKTVTIS